MDSPQITLFEEFDYLTWWSNLNESWKHAFSNNLLIKAATIQLRQIHRESITASENLLLGYKDDHEANKPAVRIEAIKYLFNSRDLILGKTLFGQDIDLTELRPFIKLEELTITDIDNFNIQSFSELKSLKKIIISAIKTDTKKIAKVQEILPKCTIIFK